MKKRLSLFHIGFAGMIFLFPSCQKNLDAGKQTHDEVRGTPLPTTGQYCRIESIWENPSASNQLFFLISYDEFENPKFMTAPTGGPFLIVPMYRTFKYDQWHRLKEYVIDGGNDFFEEYHHYSYDLNGRIGQDINYIWGYFSDPTNFFEQEVHLFQYDSQGRISRVEMHRLVHGGGEVHNYNYDAAGNLIRDDGATYDNKVSLLRTNDIWMFIHRDYSVNNPFTADTYNSSGYPTKINTSTRTTFLPNLPFVHPPDLSHSQIGYGCRQSFYY